MNDSALELFAFGRSFAAVSLLDILSFCPNSHGRIHRQLRYHRSGELRSVRQNQLLSGLSRLPVSVLASLSAPSTNSTSATQDKSVDLAYALIPLIRTLPEPTKHEVEVAFAGSIAVIWKVMAGILGLGLVSSFLMAGLPLQSVVDAKWRRGGKTGPRYNFVYWQGA